jgi:hypothetical protein
VNRAWRRYGWIHSASPLAIVAGWAGARVNEAHPRDLSARERALAKGKDAAVVAVAATGLATAITGMRFARSAPDAPSRLKTKHPGGRDVRAGRSAQAPAQRTQYGERVVPDQVVHSGGWGLFAEGAVWSPEVVVVEEQR